MEIMTQLSDAISSADTSGIQDLIFTMVKYFAENFDLRTVDTTTVAKLLDMAAPIWNPIWQYVNVFLGNFFNF
ncbi:MAG: hypothetical protein IKS39_08275 [Clostridia bacterium]|jgi:hypothetical protein|nr:hypothetical protein [Clostridia bacterium]